MEQVFKEQKAEAARNGGSHGLFGLWRSTAQGILATALREHAQLFLQDLRYALRMVRKNPGFSAAIILTLALGIGVNTAIFSLVDGVLLRPLPYASGKRLVMLTQKAPRAGISDLRFSVKEIQDYRRETKTLDQIVEYHSMPFILLGGEEPERVQTGVVSANFFDVFGIKPILGRTFNPGEDRLGAEPLLILSYDYWQRNLGGSRSVIGRTFKMNDHVHTVIGVLPPIPQFPDNNDVYMTTSSCPFRSSQRMIEGRTLRMMRVFGRLSPGVTLAQAQGELNSIARHLEQEYPQAYPLTRGYGVTATSLREELVRHARTTLLVLLGTAALVLLIACANVANLFLARLLQRDREMAIRLALGANRRRLIRQLLTESSVLSLSAGALGLGLAYATLHLLVSFTARLTARAAEIHINTSVLLFTLGVSLFTGLVFGAIPALSSRRDVARSLNDGDRSSSAGIGKQRVRSLLTVAQISISLVLLVGAGLMVRSLFRLQRVDPGFKPANVLTVFLDLDWSKYNKPDLIHNFQRTLLKKTSSLPGVLNASIAGTFPLNQISPFSSGFQIEGRSLDSDVPLPRIDVNAVSPDYFQTIGVPLMQGRLFSESDRPDTPSVLLINEAMARHYWGKESPVGARISGDRGKTWDTIVGVVGNTRQYGLDKKVEDEAYVPLFQTARRVCSLLVQTGSDPGQMTRSVVQKVYEIDPNQPVARVQTLQHIRDESIAAPRLTAHLIELFALLALVITLAGLVGVMALSVNQKQHEIGIRMALGATRGDVVEMVLRQGLRLVLLGLALGMLGALALTRVMQQLLFQVQATDPLTFAAVSMVLVAAAVLACLIPARRATRFDPIQTLRCE